MWKRIVATERDKYGMQVEPYAGGADRLSWFMIPRRRERCGSAARKVFESDQIVWMNSSLSECNVW